MKRPSNPVIPDYRPKADKKVEDITLPLKPCIVCSKMTQSYGVWEQGVVCSRKCNDAQEAKPKYPDHDILESGE